MENSPRAFIVLNSQTKLIGQQQTEPRVRIEASSGENPHWKCALQHSQNTLQKMKAPTEHEIVTNQVGWNADCSNKSLQSSISREYLPFQSRSADRHFVFQANPDKAQHRFEAIVANSHRARNSFDPPGPECYRLDCSLDAREVGQKPARSPPL